MELSVNQVDDVGLSAVPRILSDDELEKLLNEAESRLRMKAGLEPAQDDDNMLSLDTDTVQSSVQRVRLPKLEHNLEKLSYLKHENGVTRTDSSLTIPTEQRRMAEGLRLIACDQNSKKVVCQLVPFSIQQST